MPDTAHEAISCALEKFKAQPEDGHKYGFHTMLGGQHCYCLVGAVASCASGHPLDYYRRALELREYGLEAVQALYAALPATFRSAHERRYGQPTDIRSYCYAIEDYNDGNAPGDEFRREPRTKRACVGVLERAQEATNA